MRKSKKARRRKTLLLSVAALIFVAMIGFAAYVNSNQLEIEFYENAEVNINESVDNYQFLKRIKNGRILTEKTPIDTQTVGEKNIVFTVKPTFGAEKEFCFSIFVVDYEGPRIMFSEHLKTALGKDIDLLQGVSAVDHSGKELAVTVEGVYDVNTIGEYQLKYVAYDFKLNKTEEKFTLSVVDEECPKITFSAHLETTKGKSIDLLAGVSAADNSNEKITVTVEGRYDINKAGKYELKYVAYDSSGNRAEEKFTLEVKDPSSSQFNQDPGGETGKGETVTFTTSKGFHGVTKDGVTYIEGYLIANKTYSLPKTYGNGLTGETQSAFNTMAAAAKSQGYKLSVVSGFRSYSQQKSIYDKYVNRDGVAVADTYSARAGHSEHQSGLAFDLNSLSSSFGQTAEGVWLAENCYKYGFILRYPKGKTNETGYMYEPWHFRYVGEELATVLYNGGDWITMEDYFGITSQYQ